MGRGCVETKNFIGISANESIDFPPFLVSNSFPAKNNLPPPNRAFKVFFTLISPRKKGSPAHQTHRGHCSLNPKNAKHSLEVVGQYIQAHLGADIGQPLGQEARVPHPVLERAEHMLHCSPSHHHGVWHLI